MIGLATSVVADVAIEDDIAIKGLMLIHEEAAMVPIVCPVLVSVMDGRY